MINESGFLNANDASVTTATFYLFNQRRYELSICLSVRQTEFRKMSRRNSKMVFGFRRLKKRHFNVWGELANTLKIELKTRSRS
jgi:hypothetical protein